MLEDVSVVVVNSPAVPNLGVGPSPKGSKDKSEGS